MSPGRRSAVPEHPDYAGLAVLVLAVCLGGGWSLAIVISATPWTPVISDAGASLLNGLGQVLAGAIATFLGVRVGGQRADVRRDELAEVALADARVSEATAAPTPSRAPTETTPYAPDQS